MVLEFWGVRGTVPVSRKDTLKYGGQTPCASIMAAGGDILIIDAGTGLKGLGEKLVAQASPSGLRLHILLTHFHLDHIIGLPFFAPLYSSRATLYFYSPLSPQETEKTLSGLMMGRYFPVAFRETASAKLFPKSEKNSIHIGKLKISSCPLHHPQGSVAYRIEEGGASVVFSTDTEPPEKGVDERLAAFIRGATYFIYDAMFSPEEYRFRQGWGHSTWQEGVRLAERAGVHHLLLSHFNPDHADRVIDKMVSRARKEFGRTGAAREKLRIKI